MFKRTLWSAVLLAAATLAEAAAPKPAELSYPHAGVSVVLPAGYVTQRPTGDFDVFSAVREGPGGQVASAVTLALMPVLPEVTLEAFVETIMAERMLAVRNLEAVKGESAAVAGRPAAWRRIQYTFRGEPTVADRLLAVIEPFDEAQKYKLGLLVTIEARQDATASLDEARQAVLESLKLFPPRSDADFAPTLAAKPIEPAGLGLAVRLPEDWKLQTSAGRLKAYQTDYAAGGVPYPMLTITRRAAAADLTAKACTEQGLIALQKMLSDRTVTVVEQGDAALAGANGHEAAFTVAHNGQSLACAQRCVIRDGASYTASLTLQGDQVGKAKALLATFAAEMKFVPLTTPASVPAAETQSN